LALKRLEDFLNKKSEKHSSVDWEERKKQWIASVSDFYKEVQNWIRPLEEKGLLQSSFENTILREEYIGEYEVKKLILNVQGDKVVFAPIAALIIGARGRIDMVGPNGRVKFVLVPKESNEPKIISRIIQDGIDDQDSDVSDNDSIVNEDHWNIATEPPNIKFISLNEESFSDALIKVVDA
jgi:hypothetical protein